MSVQNSKKILEPVFKKISTGCKTHFVSTIPNGGI